MSGLIQQWQVGYVKAIIRIQIESLISRPVGRAVLLRVLARLQRKFVQMEHNSGC